MYKKFLTLAVLEILMSGMLAGVVLCLMALSCGAVKLPAEVEVRRLVPVPCVDVPCCERCKCGGGR